jgi:hypothetical protein
MPPGVLPGLAGHSRLEMRQMLARLEMLARWDVLTLAVLANSGALAHPYSAGAEHASQLAGTGEVSTVTRAQREVLMVAGQVADRLTAAATVAASGCRVEPGASGRSAAAAGGGKPVVRIRPGRCLLGILPGRADALGQLG